MFNLSGSEIIVILLLALVVLGPEKLPDALRRAGRTYAQLKKMGDSFQAEVKSALDEPMKEMRDTADLLRQAANPSEIVKSPAPRVVSTTSSPTPTSDEPDEAADDAPVHDTAADETAADEAASEAGALTVTDVAPVRAAPADEPAAMERDPAEDLINRTLSGGTPPAPPAVANGDGGTSAPQHHQP